MKTIRWSWRREDFIDLREPGSYRVRQVCAYCRAPGRVLWVDLNSQRARHECTRCGYGWIDAGEEAHSRAGVV